MLQVWQDDATPLNGYAGLGAVGVPGSPARRRPRPRGPVWRPSDAARAVAKAAAVEHSASPVISISGMRCHGVGLGDYLLDSELLHGRPHYIRNVSRGLTLHL